jgi:hypothetical protein
MCLLGSTFERVFVLAGTKQNVGDLLLSLFLGEGAADCGAGFVDTKHELTCIVKIHIKEILQDMYNELHWSLVVVEEQDIVSLAVCHSAASIFQWK